MTFSLDQTDSPIREMVLTCGTAAKSLPLARIPGRGLSLALLAEPVALASIRDAFRWYSYMVFVCSFLADLDAAPKSTIQSCKGIRRLMAGVHASLA